MVENPDQRTAELRQAAATSFEKAARFARNGRHGQAREATATATELLARVEDRVGEEQSQQSKPAAVGTGGP